jgi:outer membrane receptor protein involved in Fe transport
VHAVKLIILFLLLSLGVNFVQGQGKAQSNSLKDTLPIKVDSLKAVIVTAALRPHIKGDTIEYNVEHLAMQPNAVVEELLRRLPGLQIDIDGNITYNGDKIDHLLVEGQDIFGSSPTMVTRNFDASKIALVQILDRKSDDAVFKGIDDGTRTKMLNLVLKENAKNGYFGKVEVGGNAEQYYNANGVLAAFRDKEQFTAIGMTANTGVLGASADGAGVAFLSGISEPLGASAGMGIPTFSAVALHYANTLNRVGEYVEGNYQYSHYFSQPVTSTQSLQTEPDSVYGQSQQTQSVNNRDQHWLAAKYEWAPDPNSEFRVNFRGTNTEEQNQFMANGNSTFNDTIVNSNLRTIQDQMNRQRGNGGIAWKTRIGQQAGQIFSITADLDILDATTNGYLYSVDRFYEPKEILQSIDTVNQRKQIISHALTVNGSVNFTKPLWKGTVLGMSYGLALNTDQPLQATYNRGDGSYKEMIDSLSSHFRTQTLNQDITLNLQGKVSHFTYILGNDWQGYGYHQYDLIADSAMHLRYSNLAPKVLLNYTPNQGINIGFQYAAVTQQPSILQLAPIVNNSNPLYITLGNPDLKPGFNQSFKLNFHRFSTWQINLGLNMTLNSNSISTKTTTDSLGRQISQPVNVDGGRTGGINLFISRKILGFYAGFHAVGIYSQTVNFINADLSQNNSYTAGGGISLNKYVADQYNLQINTNFSYFDQVSSINPIAPVHYWTQSHSGALTIWLIPHFEIGTNATYTWQEKTSSFTTSTSVLLWNSYVSRNFLHNKLVIKAQFNNMLNQNAGISRTNSANVNTEISTNILGRYWMLSAIFHFDQKFKRK